MYSFGYLALAATSLLCTDRVPNCENRVKVGTIV
jgi:hypothetical protein